MAILESLTSLTINSSNTVDSETTADESTQTEPAEENFYVIDVSRYSTLRKFLAVTAYVLRFVRNMQSRDTRTTGPLSAKERHVAHRKWTKDCQRVTYKAETINLLSHYSSTRLPLVRQLRLFLDCDSLIRCGWRIHNAPLSESARFPYLLPPTESNYTPASTQQ